VLWLSSAGVEAKVIEKPFQVVKEVPIERIREVVKEVPVERIKEVEVPAKLSARQQADIDLGARYRAAIYLSDRKQVLRNIGSVSVHVVMEDQVREVISEERLKNKLELYLRKYNITIDDKATHMLWFTVNGGWVREKTGLFFSSEMSLREFVVFERQNGMYRSAADTWNDSTVGFAGKIYAEKGILDSFESKAESFANAYLAAQQ
jgi:hypothetical protein